MIDPFLIIGCSSKDRAKTLDLVKRLGDSELLAPVEEVAVIPKRPRRKAKPGKPVKPVVTSKKRDVFFEYVAVQFEPIAGVWEKLLHTPGVWFVLMENEKPLLVSRNRLGGFNAGQGFENWENQTVAFVSGPFAGREGKFIKGRVEIGGVRISASVGELTKI